jgi:hypothetical protein
MSRHGVWILALLAATSTGCANGRVFGLQLPQWLAPGPIDYQRNNASLHDPYADPDAGPEVVGVRPREFQKPLAEPVRNRWLTDSWWQR